MVLSFCVHDGPPVFKIHSCGQLWLWISLSVYTTNLSSKYTVQVNLYGSLFRCTADAAMVNYNYQETQLWSIIIMDISFGLHDKIHFFKTHSSGKVAYSMATLLHFFIYTVRLVFIIYTYTRCLGLFVDEVEVSFYIHRNRRFIRDGSPERPPRLSHSSWALLVCSATDLFYSQSVAWTSRLQNVHLWRAVRVASFFWHKQIVTRFICVHWTTRVISVTREADLGHTLIRGWWCGA